MRLFIAINLPEKTKNTIEKAVNKIQPLFDASARFLPRKNWHLTITFLGYQPEEAIGPILNAMKETVANFGPIKIDFESISYGPPDKPARMIWLVGAKQASKALSELKLKLEDTLAKNGIRFQKEFRTFNPHITLVKFSNTLENLPNKLISPLSLSFEAETLDLMESQLKRNGTEYESLSRFDFNQSLG